MREVVIDTETTGLSYASGDRIVEVGCVELLNHIATNNTLQFYCSVNKRMSEGAKKVSGITDDFLKDKKTFKEQHVALLDFIKNDTLIIHNADFDLGFINYELSLLGLGPIKNKVVDTMVLARKELNSRITNLDYLCRRFNIDLSERKLHGALLDSRLLAEVYLELKGGKQISMDLALKTKPTNLNKQQTEKSKETLKLLTKQEDKTSHKEMLRDIKDALWNKYSY